METTPSRRVRERSVCGGSPPPGSPARNALMAAKLEAEERELEEEVFRTNAARSKLRQDLLAAAEARALRGHMAAEGVPLDGLALSTLVGCALIRSAPAGHASGPARMAASRMNVFPGGDMLRGLVDGLAGGGSSSAAGGRRSDH